MASFPAAMKGMKQSKIKSSKVPLSEPDQTSRRGKTEARRSLPRFPEPVYEILKKDPDEFYTKVTPLGTGSFGTVYKSKHKASEILYAIKSVKPNERHDAEDLMTEIGFLRHCKSDWVCGFYEGYLFNEKLILVLELFDSGSVHDVLKMAKVKFQEPFMLEIFTQALLALEFLESRRVMHRDIKAGNILLTNQGQAKLCDFGVSRYFKTVEEQTKTIIGTPYWMAPEIVLQMGYTYNADIWSLGVTLIEMNDGNPPFSRIDPVRAMFIAQRRPPPKFSKPRDLSSEMLSLLEKCVVKDKAVRMTSSQLLADPFISPIASRLTKATPQGASAIVKVVVEENIAKVMEFRQNTKFIDDDNIGSDGNSTKGESTQGGSFIHIGKPNAKKKPRPKKEPNKHTYRDNLVRRDKPEDSLVVIDDSYLNTVDALDDDSVDNPDFNSLIVRQSVVDNMGSMGTFKDDDSIRLLVNGTSESGTTLTHGSGPQIIRSQSKQSKPQRITRAQSKKLSKKLRNAVNNASKSGRIKFGAVVPIDDKEEEPSDIDDLDSFDDQEREMVDLADQVSKFRAQLWIDIKVSALNAKRKIADLKNNASVVVSKAL